jgi:hypothetical protein
MKLTKIMMMIWNNLELYDSYAWIKTEDSFNIFKDIQRPQRKIKAEFVDNGSNYKQSDWDISVLQRGMYLTNTESINNERDGIIYKSDVDTYVSVAAGLKGLIKGAVDNSDRFSYTYVDVSPAALDYRMFVDSKLKENHKENLDDIWNEYFSIPETMPLPLYGGGYNSIETALDDYLREVGIDRKQWYEFLKTYSECDKTYIKIDLINNIKLLVNLIKSDDKIWFWYSNAFDWHQFRHTETSYFNWKKYIEQRIPNIDLCGHTPPFTSSA